MSDLHASLTIPFAPAAPFHPGDLEIESGGEPNLPALLEFIYVKIEDDELSALNVVRQGLAHFRIRYTGPGALSFYTEPDPSPDNQLTFINKGLRQEYRRVVLTFDGQVEHPLPGSGDHRVIHTSGFFDTEGNPLPPPRFRAHPRSFVHDQPAFGAVLVEISQPFTLLQVIYSIPPGPIPDAGYPALPIQIRAPGRVAHASVARHATLQQVSYSKPPRKQRKVEIKRFGVVDRIFPTPPASTDPPPPDPLTGRDDYTDVERITSILYAVVEEDEKGQVAIQRDTQGKTVNGLKYIQENLNTQPPDNSYVLESFQRPLSPDP